MKNGMHNLAQSLVFQNFMSIADNSNDEINYKVIRFTLCMDRKQTSKIYKI